ncbi:hypothetical protein Syun_018128 [Stephania yunnanensis]|uniref:F-box domain-containing protein n=1 Tax=Stephania yunnanensis TaxID=152371 RepID=A0AAP0ITY2_9MAGN
MTTKSANMKKTMTTTNDELDYAYHLEEIALFKILPRLPIKSIMRFRLVCKHWRKVITNDFLFITKQANHGIHSSSNQSAFMYQNRDDSLSVISFEDHNRYRLSPSFPPSPRPYSKLLYAGSCNGLVFGFNSFEWIFVGNPITHLIDFVDNFHNNDYLSIHGVALAVEPPNAGPNLKRFKLIRPVHNSNKMTFNVYCSAKKKWHDSNAHVEMDSKIFSWRSHSPHNVYVKGKVHWFNDKFMVWFNVREDVAGTIPLPAKTGGITGASVGISDGELSYCNITIDSKLNVWLRRGEWERLYEVSLDTIIIDNWDVIAPDTAKPMNCGTDFLRDHLVSTMSYEGGDMLMMSMVMEREKRVFGFNSKTRELKELSAPDLMQSCTSAWPYKAIILSTQIGRSKEK